MAYDDIYADRKKKIVFDMPRQWVAEVARVTTAEHNGNVSAYLREVVKNDLRARKKCLQTDRLPSQAEYDRVALAGNTYAVDPPKRYSGFIGGLLRSTWRKNWFNRQNENAKKSIDNSKHFCEN